jgi:hypothetical protein
MFGVKTSNRVVHDKLTTSIHSPTTHSLTGWHMFGVKTSNRVVHDKLTTSIHSPTTHSLTGWHMFGVKSSNRVVHDKICRTDIGEYQLLPSTGSASNESQPAFASLPDLVEFYLAHGDEAGLGYKLTESNPIYDNHQLIQERTGSIVRATVTPRDPRAPAVPSKNNATTQQYDSVDQSALPGMVRNLTYVPDDMMLGNPIYDRPPAKPPTTSSAASMPPANQGSGVVYADVRSSSQSGDGYLDVVADADDDGDDAHMTV